MSLAVKAARMQAAGDPGLFGSIGRFLGGAVRTVAGVGATLLPGPAGMALRAVSRIGAGGPQIQPRAPAAMNGRARAGLFGGPGGGVPGAAARAAIPVEAGLACPPGMHPNKSAYFLKSGEFVPAKTRCVPSRRRNPGNSRANDRAIGRIESAKKMASRLARITIRKECPHK